MILVALPFADLTLLNANAATAVIVGAFLSIVFLGEKFQWKYDIPASFFILVGSFCTVALSNKEDKSHDLVQAKRLLESRNGIYYASFLIVVLLGTIYSI